MPQPNEYLINYQFETMNFGVAKKTFFPLILKLYRLNTFFDTQCHSLCIVHSPTFELDYTTVSACGSQHVTLKNRSYIASSIIQLFFLLIHLFLDLYYDCI